MLARTILFKESPTIFFLVFSVADIVFPTAPRKEGRGQLMAIHLLLHLHLTENQMIGRVILKLQYDWSRQSLGSKTDGYTCLFVCLLGCWAGIRSFTNSPIKQTPMKHLEYGRGSFSRAEILLLCWCQIVFIRSTLSGHLSARLYFWQLVFQPVSPPFKCLAR